MLGITIYNDAEKLIPTVSFDVMIFFATSTLDLTWNSNLTAAVVAVVVAIVKFYER